MQLRATVGFKLRFGDGIGVENFADSCIIFGNCDVWVTYQTNVRTGDSDETNDWSFGGFGFDAGSFSARTGADAGTGSEASWIFCRHMERSRDGAFGIDARAGRKSD